LLPESATAEHFERYAEIQRTYPRYDPDLVSSHNDLNPNNILFDGNRVWAVDWEVAFANDRYVDLAMLGNTFVKSDDDEAAYLHDYFDNEVDDYKRARFFLMRQVCHMCHAMLFFRLAAASKPANTAAEPEMTAPDLKDFYQLLRSGEVALGSYQDQLLYAKVLLGESLRMMRTARFMESIRIMNAAAG
jgi:Ser/Thr protein kinase RdoA (MazF antagonist)